MVKLRTAPPPLRGSDRRLRKRAAGRPRLRRRRRRLTVTGRWAAAAAATTAASATATRHGPLNLNLNVPQSSHELRFKRKVKIGRALQPNRRGMIVADSGSDSEAAQASDEPEPSLPVLVSLGAPIMSRSESLVPVTQAGMARPRIFQVNLLFRVTVGGRCHEPRSELRSPAGTVDPSLMSQWH